MGSYKIVASYLKVDELQYELKKRGFATTCNAQSMGKELRQILALEKLDETIVYPKCAVIFDDKINACEGKLNVLQDKITIFTCDSSRKEFLVLDSRLLHLMCRVDNIPMTNVDEKTRRATLASKSKISVTGYLISLVINLSTYLPIAFLHPELDSLLSMEVGCELGDVNFIPFATSVWLA
ncbi:hypothetical protein FQA39_LY00283 [Lamprigera yunnana]|nr:hypothetical protein FQA39_LY00283 [Lamprigera yunnana]